MCCCDFGEFGWFIQWRPMTLEWDKWVVVCWKHKENRATTLHETRKSRMWTQHALINTLRVNPDSNTLLADRSRTSLKNKKLWNLLEKAKTKCLREVWEFAWGRKSRKTSKLGKLGVKVWEKMGIQHRNASWKSKQLLNKSRTEIVECTCISVS